MNVPTVDF